MIRAWAGLDDGTGGTLDCAAMRAATLADPVNNLQQCYQEYSYTGNGQIATVSDANGNVTTYEYDGFDRLAKTSFPDKATPGTSSATDFETYAYDKSGNMLTKTTRRGNDPVANSFDGEAISFVYDKLNRLLERLVPGSGGDDKFAFTYDLAGRRLTALHDGTTLSYAYDNAGRMLSQSHASALPVSYQYDQAGNNTKLTYPDGFDVDFTYDALSRVSTAKDGARVLATLTYDRLSRSQSVAYANGTSANYAFTSRGDLTDHDWSFAGGANANYDFTYNGVGQLLTESVSDALLEWLPAMDSVDSYTANGLNQYTDIKGVAPTYDGNGNTTTDHRGRSYVYDAENVMREASGLASGTASYDYWADGARRSKTYASVTSAFYYTGDQEIAEYNGATLTRRFVRLPGSVDEPVLMIDYTLDNACTNTSYATCERWAHQNRLGSVVATTDSAGVVVEKYTYSSYGVSDDATGFPFRFTGQKFDAETGLYYYKARYYDPETGRFLQTDPIGYGDQMNLYGYVGNDPVNKYDPSGLCTGSRLTNDDGSCSSTGGNTTQSQDLTPETTAGGVPHSSTRQGHQGNGVSQGGTFMGRPYGSSIASKNSRKDYGSPNRALNAASDEIRGLAKEHYPDYYKRGQIIPEFAQMIPEVGAEIIEMANGRYTYNIIVGRSDGKGNGMTPWSYNDASVAARIHFHWNSSRPSRADRENAEAQYRLRKGDSYYQEAIGTFVGFRMFFNKGEQR